ncbi:lipase family protein [Photobacterium frigidiphilum]|uniref:lipase family protein n=1 Tax=Photobacterium frigidiphilum TaxID=264736 RepID=UPI003D0CCA77
MAAISPRVAVDLANAAYAAKDLQNMAAMKMRDETRKHFSFDHKNVIKGTSGGYFWRPETSFALLGKGKSLTHKNDHVIAIRGTQSVADGLTDITCHSVGSDTGSQVHAGFQRTFVSMKPALTRYLRQSGAGSQNGIIHCVGHSLGGGVASLVADWIKYSPEFKGRVYLYTFGAPRVGLRGHAVNTTARVDKIFRCVHGADPVAKVPVWPFFHAPYNGQEYLLDREQGLKSSAHFMEAGPGYINTANRSSWDMVNSHVVANIRQRVVLNYQNRVQASSSAAWADKIGAALMTVLVDGGYAATISMLQAGGASIGSVYDTVARSLTAISHISVALAEQVKGLLGHMLVFAGKGINTTIKFTERFIRWVFEAMLNKLNKVAKSALSGNR